ncbi:P-type transport ATPase (probable substrate cobalt/metal cation) (plasmid) [Natrialba magadii ATCC 43099]|uniref:Cadmium-translocating P-type ATPase n=1 Tax=Natrialba magadii (strain ATCC 43099 / DSM 3394 / CCM 3739 / CIP 104546 / IAM 13178 / JCM 8861 / NBRC 102185 / NCIMB 2190 / MS3) TaxID=547559 RepID=D3T0Y9_NATMM|nr:heavy metal translocating P-type ATPase [Natrialba magadii]ADD07248.1 P-type transport ATPase (probable substrate cobalt/metal cation) [Natrialba magadii ATCC 43099]ELY34358.1 cadmium-translocating P-type ATPase [Natrialba magadii ATCC 43099]
MGSLSSSVSDVAGRSVALTERLELRRQAVFVVLTFFGMIGGLLGSWFGAPPWFVWGCYGVAYVFGGWYGLKESIAALREPAVEIDLLMIIAALGALYIGAPFEGAMLLFLFSLSGVLEDYAIGRSRTAIKSLVEMRPESAQVLRDGEESTTPIDDVAVGDVFVVRPGERLPLDGVVESGESTVDQSSLTGESVPVAKEPGDEVFSGTINETGSLEVRVTHESEESAISRLITMVEQAQEKRAPTQQLIDRFEQPYVLGVFAMTAIAIVLPLSLLNHSFEPTFYRAMTLMVAASPCAVIISTPAAVLSAISAGGRQGVLFKGGEHIETAGDVDAIAFDKTGTLTEGNTRLTDVYARENVVSTDGGAVDSNLLADSALENNSLNDDQLLSLAAAVQSRSEHHLAEATVEAAEERSLDVPDVSDFEAVVGKGVNATVEGRTIHIGNPRYVETVLADRPIDGRESGLDAVRELEDNGKTSVLVVSEADEGLSVLGWLGFTDTIRSDAAEMIEQLRERGVEQIVMLTGDNERVAQYIADELGIDEVYAELLPEEKVEHVEELQERHEAVAMVGDGVNDAPALATADISVGMGGVGTDVALETADIVLMSDKLDRLPYAFALSKETRRTLYINFAIAFGAIGIMVIAILTAGIPLPVAVVGHEGSTVLVSLIGLRLLRFDD